MTSVIEIEFISVHYTEKIINNDSGNFETLIDKIKSFL